jgi:arginase
METGRRVEDHGDASGFRWRPDAQRPKAMNLAAVLGTAAEVADKVEAALTGEGAVLVIGGDCTVELGTVAGALRGDHPVGLIYIDLDVDLNTPETSDGALDWTGVAHLLDLQGAESQLSGLGPRRPMLAPADILYVGADNITAVEAQVMRALALQRIGLAEVKADPVAAAATAVVWGQRFDRLLIHLDVDVLAFTDFPIAENVRRCDGLSFDALSALLGPLVAAPNWRALTITEVNPDHAPDESETFARLISLLSETLSA